MDRGLILAGDIFVGLYSGAVFQGYFSGAINVTELVLQPGDVETKDRVSKKRSTFGQALDSIIIPQPWSLAFTTNTQNLDTLKMAFLGASSAVSVTGTTVTDEEVTAKLGLWVPLAQRNLDDQATFEVQDETDTTTYVLDTDYSVDFRNGMILAIEGGAISADEVLHVDYTYKDLTGTKIEGAQQTSIAARILLDGHNLADNERVSCLIHRATLSPTSPADLMSEDFMATQFTGTMVTPSGLSAPFRYEELGVDPDA